MLFDLRSSGRRRTIKVIYVTLAFLMGGGLILFGIGGGTSLNGGLFDAFSGNSGGGAATSSRVATPIPSSAAPGPTGTLS